MKRAKHGKGEVDDNEKNVEKLREVTGYSKRKARTALEEVGWSLQAALNIYTDEQEQQQQQQGSRSKRRGRGREREPVSSAEAMRVEEATARSSAEAFFQAYANKEEAIIGVEGIARLCENIGVDPEDPVMLLIAFNCNAQRILVFTREEFVQGMIKMKCTSEAALKVYAFSYGYAKDPTQKSLSRDTALELWRVLLQSRFAILPEWLEYISKNHKHPIMKDEWNQFWDFARNLPKGCNAKAILKPPTDDSAMPILIEDFVMWYLNDGVSPRAAAGKR